MTLKWLFLVGQFPSSCKDYRWIRIRVGSTLSLHGGSSELQGGQEGVRQAVPMWALLGVLWQSVSAGSPSFPVAFRVPCPGDPVHHPVSCVWGAGLAQLCAEVAAAGAPQEMKK